MFCHIEVVTFGVNKGNVTLLKTDHMEIVVACKTVLATLKDVKAEVYVIQQAARHQNFAYVYGIMELGLILMKFIGTIKSGNIMINKIIHSYLGNFVMPKATWFCAVKDTGEGDDIPPFHGFLT